MKRKLDHELEFPTWAVMTKKRRRHVGRVVALLERWAKAMRIPKSEAAAWRAAGILHDAYRDAPSRLLRQWSGDRKKEVHLLHGPASANHARKDGERRAAVLEAVRHHTEGWARWKRTGRALYMADFLEPGRRFLRPERKRIAARVPSDFNGAFRDVVRLRISWSLHNGGALFPQAVDLWHAVR
jgi:HD superfamily phosphohydrolase YqeK